MKKITIEMIKRVRDKTRAGIVDCKKMLQSVEGNEDKAIEILRQKMVSKDIYLKEQNILPKEGLVHVSFKGNKAVMFELNTETDFVARSRFFLDFCKKLEKILFLCDNYNLAMDDFLNYSFEDKKIKDIILEQRSIFGENIFLRRFNIINKKNEESFGIYQHYNKIACLVILNKHCSNIEHDLPVHIAFYNPKFICKEEIDPDFIHQNKNKIYEEIKDQYSELSKQKIEKELNKRLDNFLNEICLLEQYLYNDPNKKIFDYLKLAKVNIIKFYLYQLGN
ncbi:MAG: elongation factor Ts [Candidatus Phytoplasma cynodontis]|uniref:translation elongation factor Ts n=1 Tax='Cynodon dactylon' phytoplasma TaxID=295320 RepID=UPI001265D0FA|nr:translation elongation factor Ts ['Cynodon dactylon' phytoplasma]KAB8121760.1 translation elongation factor Ts ['Cynodon dactylon' phytoplasma]WIA07854.1 MAG: elongation factor Ts [Candidatus Phytoplasma cynodontis]